MDTSDANPLNKAPSLGKKSPPPCKRPSYAYNSFYTTKARFRTSLSLKRQDIFHSPYCLNSPQTIEDFQQNFDHLWIEIGFGGGEHLLWQALHHKNIAMIGIDPFLHGLAQLHKAIERQKIQNIAFVPNKGEAFLDTLAENSVQRCFLLFSDPWPKKRHAKRRYLQLESAQTLSIILKKGGLLRIATDHETMAQWSDHIMGKQKEFSRLHFEETTNQSPSRPSDWPATRYENKAKKEGKIRKFFQYERL